MDDLMDLVDDLATTEAQEEEQEQSPSVTTDDLVLQEDQEDEGPDKPEKEVEPTAEEELLEFEEEQEEEPAEIVVEKNKFLEEINSRFDSKFESTKEVVERIAELELELDQRRIEADEQNSVFANETIKKANEIAQAGGDINAVLNLGAEIQKLSTTKEQYKNVPNIEFVKSWLLNSMGIKEEALDNQLDLMTEDAIESKGEELRKQIDAQIDAQIDDLNNKIADDHKKAIEKRNDFKKGIAQSISKMESIAGVKLQSTQKQQIKQVLLSQNSLKKYFPIDPETGKAQTDVWVQSAAILELFPKLINVYKNRGLSQANKDHFNKLSNIKQKATQSTAKANTRSSENDINPLDF